MKRIEGLLREAERSQVPLLKKRRAADEQHLPIIVNFVATTPILPPAYSLPLMSISAKWGCSQYAPNLFAANIIKIKDSVATSTVLLFVSGIMVVVSGQSMNHARNVSQYIRLNIERTTCMMKDENNRVYEGTLLGRTSFSECAIHNIVGHGSVGRRLHLQALVDAAPECWKWFPDLFPGAKGKIWLTDGNRCECDALTTKCKCSIKVIVFDTGQVVITGGRTIEAVNMIFGRIRALAPQFESTQQGHIPREDRFYSRLSTMMTPAVTTASAKGKRKERQQMKPEEAVACILAGVQIEPSSAPPPPLSAQDATPLMRMAEAGRVEDVEMLLMLDPDQKNALDSAGKTALQRLSALSEKTPEIRKIMELLSKA